MSAIKFNVSVIVPAYNEEKNISRAIDSILSQSYPPLQIVVVDDGSTDSTARLVKEKYGDKVDYVFQENKGLASARNTGIAHCKNEFVAFLDSDDEWTCNFLETMKSIFEKKPELMWAISGYERRCENGVSDFIKLLPSKYADGHLIENYFECQAETNISITNTIIIRREVFEAIGVFDHVIGKYGEDLDMWFRIALAYPSLGYAPIIGSIYWRREGSITSSGIIDIERFVERIQKTEAHALRSGITARKKSDILIMDWVWRAIKYSVKQRQWGLIGYLSKYYGGRLPLGKRIIIQTLALLNFGSYDKN